MLKLILYKEILYKGSIKLFLLGEILQNALNCNEKTLCFLSKPSKVLIIYIWCNCCEAKLAAALRVIRCLNFSTLRKTQQT